MTGVKLCRSLPAVLCTVALASVPWGVKATDSGNWEYTASIYLWAPGIHVETSSGSDYDIDFDDSPYDKAYLGGPALAATFHF